jgi:hypothetical protein
LSIEAQIANEVSAMKRPKKEQRFSEPAASPPPAWAVLNPISELPDQYALRYVVLRFFLVKNQSLIPS